jgi:hypothetical protein
MRTFIAVVLIAFLGSAHAAERAKRTIDLDHTGALEILATDNPQHYQKVVEIIQVAREVSCQSLPEILQVRFDAASVHGTGQLILLSHPPKRRLSFQLDDTAYVTNVVLPSGGEKLVPAK